MKIDLSTHITFNQNETAILLSWYENKISKESRFGSSEILFPEEEFLARNLKKLAGTAFKIDELDLEVILEWVEKALFPRIGGKVYLLPDEESIYKKLKRASEEILLRKREQDELNIKYAEKIKKRSWIASWLADKMISDTKEKKEERKQELLENEKLNKRVQNIADRLGPIVRQREMKKNRSLEEKIAASNKLKQQLDEIRKNLK